MKHGSCMYVESYNVLAEKGIPLRLVWKVKRRRRRTTTTKNNPWIGGVRFLYLQNESMSLTTELFTLAVTTVKRRLCNPKWPEKGRRIRMKRRFNQFWRNIEKKAWVGKHGKTFPVSDWGCLWHWRSTQADMWAWCLDTQTNRQTNTNIWTLIYMLYCQLKLVLPIPFQRSLSRAYNGSMNREDHTLDTSVYLMFSSSFLTLCCSCFSLFSRMYLRVVTDHYMFLIVQCMMSQVISFGCNYMWTGYVERLWMLY